MTATITTMPRRYIGRAVRLAAAAALVVVLTAGALACGSGDESAAAIQELERKLQQVEEQNTDTLIRLEVFEARVSQLEEQNGHLSGRVAQLEQDKEALLSTVTALAALAPGGADLVSGAAGLVSGAMGGGSPEPVTRETATEEQRQMVQQFAECGLKSGGTPENLIAALSGPAADGVWTEIESGAMTIGDVEEGLPVVCAGQ